MPNLQLMGITPSLKFAEIEAVAFWPQRGEEEARKRYLCSIYKLSIVQMVECIFDQCNEPAGEIGLSVKSFFSPINIPLIESIGGIGKVLNAPDLDNIENEISKRRNWVMPVMAGFLKIYLNDLKIMNDPVAVSMNRIFDLLSEDSLHLGRVYPKSTSMANWVKFKDGIHIIAAISCWAECIKHGDLSPRDQSDEIDATDIQIILGFAKTFLAWGIKAQAPQAKSFLLDQATAWNIPEEIEPRVPFFLKK
jgi:hypothetical protein